ncbi:NLR family CARD domain-containing protein 4 [Lingula anatina]|uniref:NLR family CARD domain-containing protein 4 n=1 Tax=Lingula anatina TaxID=7574 RepID=A0A1S3K9S2_LINAN|nr:NLR family CARD domain-containing protein 4 [Lingula anatina]|eukprot:XP_013419001.1 NLR family CARD domain-containing protein 4 [Lingula anatina]
MQAIEKAKVRKNYTLLVEDLQVQYYVADFLYQQGVLSFDDKERILAQVTSQDKTKMLLDMILKTDRPDSYAQFLKSLEEEYGYLQDEISNTTVTEEEIRIFQDPPPEAEVLEAVRRELQLFYIKTFTKQEPLPWNEDFVISLPDVYTSLEILEKDTYKRHLMGPVSLQDLFTTRPLPGSTSPARHIYIDGVAGSGKTTLCQKLAYDWATGNEQNSVCHFSLVLKIELQFVRAEMRLVDAVFDQLLPEDFNLSKDEVIHCIHHNQSSMLLILDGLTDASQYTKQKVLDFLAGKVLRHITSIVTSRPTKISAKYFDLRLRCKGFNKENAKKFIAQYFSGKQEKCYQSLLDEVDEHSLVEELVQNPFNTLLLCALWEDNQCRLPRSLTQLFSEIVFTSVKRYCHKHKAGFSGSEMPWECEQMLSEIEELAFTGITQHECEFSRDDVDAKLSNCDAYKLGFLARQPAKSRLQTTAYYRFSHKNVQEFLAARHALRLSDEKLQHHFQEFLVNQESRILCIFIVGVLKDHLERLVPLFEILAEFCQNSCRDDQLIVTKHRWSSCDSSLQKYPYIFNKTFRPFAVCFNCLNEADNHPECVSIIAQAMPKDLFLDIKSFKNHYLCHEVEGSCFAVLENIPCPRSVMVLELSYFSEKDPNKAAQQVVHAVSHIAKHSEGQYELFIYCDGLNFYGFASIPFILDILGDFCAKEGNCSFLKKLSCINFLIHGCSILRCMTDEEIWTEMKLQTPNTHCLPPIVFYHNKLPCPHASANPEVGVLRANPLYHGNNRSRAEDSDDSEIVILETEGSIIYQVFKKLNPSVHVEMHKADIPIDFFLDMY